MADKGPPTWQDALSSASQAIAAGMSAPDADVKFGLAMIGALSQHQQRKAQPPGGAGAGASGVPGAGGGPAGSAPAPPGMAPSGGPPGAAPNQSMKNQAAPGGPIPGGMSPGLGVSGDAQNADELRRVLSDVAGQ